MKKSRPAPKAKAKKITKTKPAVAAKGLSPQALQHVKEVLLIIGGAFALFMLVALLSYHRVPLLQLNPQALMAENAGGPMGYYLAHFSFMVLGYFAYVIPGLILLSAWMGWTGRLKAQTIHHPLIGLRSIGFLLLIIAGTGLLQQAHLALPLHSFESGGRFGQLVVALLLPSLGMMGSSVCLIALWCAGITLFTGWSWLKAIDQCGQLALQLGSYLKQGLQKLVILWQQRQARLMAARAVALKTVAKKIAPPANLPAPAKAIKAASEVVATAKPQIIAPQAPKVSAKTAKPVQTAAGLPSLDLLDPAELRLEQAYSVSALETLSRNVEARLQDFGIQVRVVAVHPGPVVTRFEMELAAGLKVSKISGLAKDLARSLSVTSVRVVEVIPGKSVVGLELPNPHREMVRLTEVLVASQYQQANSPLSLALGKDIAGVPVVVDLAKMPHLLVAGTTGSGKSVGLNAMLLSLLYKATPAEVRMIMVDPKMLELSIYDGIPHLLAPVVTDMKEAANALRWCVAEMDRRYKLMAALGVRNLAGYNAKVSDAAAAGKPILDPFWQAQQSDAPEALDTLPFIVVLVDEFADMMMVVGKKVEELIARIAQKARAAGIHLILATQRPSVDVITGLIKANIPTRIAFQVSSKIDSRTILDQGGAEQLLGHGDMLYLPPGTGVPIRVHGAFVADHEVHQVVSDWKLRGQPEYIPAIVQGQDDEGTESGSSESSQSETDPLYDQAVQIVIQSRRASISNVQRRLKIGYNRAARLIEEMEAAGIVSPMESNGNREVLVNDIAS